MNDRESLARTCNWCDRHTTVFGPRFGSLCDDCFVIEQNISRGLEAWRSRRAIQQIAPTLRDALVGHGRWEWDEVRSALSLLDSEWAETGFSRITEFEGQAW